MGRAKISLEKKIETKASLQAGFSQRYIGKKLSLSKTWVWSVAKTLNQNLPLSNSCGQERKKVSITTDDRNLLCLWKQDRTKTTQKSSSELVLSNGEKFSARPIRRRLLDMEYKSYTAKSQPF